MLCEKAYYPNGTGENREKLCCKDERNTNMGGRCPLIYWCKVSEKYENTTDMFDCVFREKNDDR